jgi:AAA15 family ATPase/GTPase
MSLEYFRQDEIWFVEKNKDGASHLYSLSDFKPRYDKDIRKSYLQGRFGAIPFIENNVFLEE